MMVVSNWGDMSDKKKMAIMPMHSWGKIFRDRIHHHFKCKAPQNLTKESWVIYKTIASLDNESTVDGETDLQDEEEMDDEEDEEEEDTEDGEEEDGEEGDDDKEDKDDEEGGG